MSDNKNDKFPLDEKSKEFPDFEDIKLDFQNIEEIKKRNEDYLEQLLISNESEISRLMQSVYDVNQIYFNPEYFSKILENRIKKILNFDGFFLFFKKEKKLQENKKVKERSPESNEGEIESKVEKEKEENIYIKIDNSVKGEEKAKKRERQKLESIKIEEEYNNKETKVHEKKIEEVKFNEKSKEVKDINEIKKDINQEEVKR